MQTARDELTRAWHSLDPWPDTVPGLTRMKARSVIAPHSNGHIALLLNMARRAGAHGRGRRCGFVRAENRGADCRSAPADGLR